MRCVIQHIQRLIHRFREQARSHRVGLENLKQWLRTYRFHARFYLLSMAFKQFRLR